MAVTLLVAMRSSSQILTRAFMTTKITSVCGGVHLVVTSVLCLLYSRRVRFKQKEQNNNHKVVAERWLLQEEEDLISHKVPLSGCCSESQQY